MFEFTGVFIIACVIISNVATYFITRERYKQAIIQGYIALRQAHFTQLIVGGQLKLQNWFAETTDQNEIKLMMRAIELNIPIEELLLPKHFKTIQQAAGFTPEEIAVRPELEDIPYPNAGDKEE